MEINSILPTQSIRFTETGQTLEKKSPVPLITSIQDNYGFIEVPRTLSELDFKKGVNFLHGYYKGKIIEKMQIYENGLLCEARESTNLTDDFIDEILIWIAGQGFPVKQTGVRAYTSQMEVMSPIDLSKHFSKLDAMGQVFSEFLGGYGQPVLAYKVSGFRMHYDTLSTPIPRAPEFAFERRAGAIYSTNQFYSSAPLRTDDHLKILETMEGFFA